MHIHVHVQVAMVDHTHNIHVCIRLSHVCMHIPLSQKYFYLYPLSEITLYSTAAWSFEGVYIYIYNYYYL